MELFKHTLPFVRLTVVKRPSAVIKSPYVADVITDDGRAGLCHTPGLGCCGLVEPGRIIYGTASRDSAKTDYTAQVAECADSDGIYYVGIHPMVSQAAARGLLDTVWANAKWKSEVAVDDHTRLDYVGTCASGKKVYVEIKTAMVSLETSVGRRDRRAVFPEGYRKKKGEPVSPRAIKHAETLGALCAHEETEAAVLVFLVPRSDCGGGMKVNRTDPAYVRAVTDAIRKGMIVRAFALDYGLDGTVCLAEEVPFYY
jgi:DNA-binding sugar fermentation-stimulating protein